MCEQDTRGFAVMSDLPLLDAASVEDAYRLVKVAFDVSERIGTPVFVRLVTSISSSFAPVEVDDDPPDPEPRPAQLIRDIDRFTKAGSLICLTQHRDVIKRLERAGEVMRELGLNTLQLSATPGGLGIVACGVVAAYLDEAFEMAQAYGFDPARVSLLTLSAVHPFPAAEARELLVALRNRSSCSRSSSRSSSAASTSRRRRWAGGGSILGKETGPLRAGRRIRVEAYPRRANRCAARGEAAGGPAREAMPKLRNSPRHARLRSVQDARIAASSWASTRPCARRGTRRTR